MMIEKKFFMKTFTIMSVLALAVLVFGVMAIQNADAKLNSESILLAGLKDKQPAGQQVQEQAEISLTSIVDSSVKELISLQPLIEQLESIESIKIISEKTLEANSAEAVQLLEEYNIERIPALLIQGETLKAQVLTQNWESIGSIENDGTMVLRNAPPVYLEVSSGRVRGLVNAVYITVPDKNEVFDAEVFQQIIANAFGIKPVEERTIDYNSSEGKSIISKYFLQKLPTVLLSGDLNAYAGFEEAWQQVGSLESDGNFVFRSPELLRGLEYLDLNSGLVVKAEG